MQIAVKVKKIAVKNLRKVIVVKNVRQGSKSTVISGLLRYNAF